MAHPYKNLLSPIKVRNTVLKNRIEASTSEPHYLNGPETYPNDAAIQHYRDKAKGAAIVNVTGFGERGDTRKYPPFLPMTQFPDYDVFDMRNHNQIIRLTDTIHFYQSVASATADFISDERTFMMGRGQCVTIPKKDNIDDFTTEEMKAIEQYHIAQAMMFKRVGFDMMSIHCAYGRTLMAKTVSPLYNHREDEYGGSLDNRIRLIKDIAEGIKRVCGEDFLVHILISGSEIEGGNTVDDVIEILKKLDHCVDVVQLRGYDADMSHPTGFEDEIPFAAEAAQIKASGVKMLIESVGGYFYPETCERVIKEGMFDLVGMARSWICNPNYGEMVYDGDIEDMIPCIRCNKCHTYCLQPPFRSACSVNPLVGLETDLPKLTFNTKKKYRVAVVGGGPAGMKAAIVSADRGHQVTIFEAGDALGGQIRHSDFVKFKWPLKDFKDYLIRQVSKRENITVCLNTKVSPKDIKAQGFDVVLVGIGSEPIVPTIEGLNDTIINAVDALDGRQITGKKVVIIGGGEIGVETGMHMAQSGNEVVVLEMRDTLAADTNPIHYRSNFEYAWNHTDNFSFILNAKVFKVEDGAVVYENTKTGEVVREAADCVILSAGMRAKKDEAFAYKDAADHFALIGDVADKTNNLMESMESAYYAASRF